MSRISLKDKDLTLVWSHRNSLSSLLSPFARGLPIFAQSIPTWDLNNQKKFHNLLSLWPICDPSHGLELLGSQYCDIKLRLKATEMISQYSEDDFLDLLPQLLQVRARVICIMFIKSMTSLISSVMLFSPHAHQ